MPEDIDIFWTCGRALIATGEQFVAGSQLDIDYEPRT